MKLTPSVPVTVESVRYGERWFPLLHRTPDGLLLLTMEYGHDAHFSPNFRLQSHDGGRTWHTPTDNVPRAAWVHSFADGELFEIDTYGIRDPNTTATAVYYGAWSQPGRPDTPRRELVRIEAPSAAPIKLSTMAGAYPTFHWWDLWNGLHDTEDVSADDIKLAGPNFTDGLETEDGRLLAVGYWKHGDQAVNKDATWVLESTDRGRTWTEVGTITDLAPDAPLTNEATLVRLKDGRLYAALRTEGRLVQAWSEDEGRHWTKPAPISLIDADHQPAHVWPQALVLDDGTLVLAYGRPGKHLIVDPTGTGESWQGRLDLHQHELDHQARQGVPERERLRGVVGHDINVYLNRHTDSGDYLTLVATGPRELLVMYDVQHFIEHWNAHPISGIRMVRVTLED